MNLPLSGTPGIECRSGGATGDHTVVVTFANPVTVNGNFQADVIAGNGAIGNGGVPNNGMVTVNGSGVTIPLTNVADVQNLTLMLFNVNNGAGSGDVAIPLSLLAGDTNGNGQVTGTDISQTKALSGGAITASTFRADVVPSDSINSSRYRSGESAFGKRAASGQRAESALMSGALPSRRILQRRLRFTRRT